MWAKSNQLKHGAFYSLSARRSKAPSCRSKQIVNTRDSILNCASRWEKSYRRINTGRPEESLAISTGTDRRSAQISLILGSLATLSAFGTEIN